VFMNCEPRGMFSGHMVSIILVVNLLGEQSVSRLLTIHALSGCDTTSAVYGHCKASALKKLSTDSGISHLFSIMSCETASTTDVGQAGSHLVVLLYGGRVGVDSLNHLCYTTYITPHRKLRKFLPNFAVIVAKFCDTTLPKFAKFL